MENLLFASRIKNTQEHFEHMENVERVADLLGLRPCLKLKTTKLSGGQYKRVSIAQELLSKPDILILDEPTSGLDSLTCFRTVSVLRELASMSQAGYMPPLAIIMTIHQPQIKVFNLFHHVYIMSSMGQCIYEGRPQYLIDTVADCCELLPPPDDLNPASFIIDIASEVYGQKPMDQLTKLQRENFAILHPKQSKVIKRDWQQSEPAYPIDIYVENNKFAKDKVSPVGIADLVHKDNKTSDDIQPNDKLIISDRLKRCNNHNCCFWLHTRLLIRRLWLSMWRDPLLATTRIIFHLLIPFVFYFVYSQKSGEANACPLVERELDLQTMTSTENLHRLQVQHNELILTFENVSLFFLLLYSFSMCVLAVTALSFPLNMKILLKETSNGWYSMPRFVMAKTLADLPIELAMPMISVSIAYVLTGQPSSYLSWRMLTITAVMTLCSLISQTLGLLFGAYFMNNVQAAVFVSQASSLPWIMLSGFTTRVSELPTVLRWLSFCSIYRLGIESIVAVRYGFGVCPCDPEIVDNTPTKIIGVPDHLRSVMSYYLDVNSETNPNTTSTSGSEDIFQRLASTLARANTYGEDISTCNDLKPYIMSARGVDEDTLPTFIVILVLIFIILKILLFFVVGLRAS